MTTARFRRERRVSATQVSKPEPVAPVVEEEPVTVEEEASVVEETPVVEEPVAVEEEPVTVEEEAPAPVSTSSRTSSYRRKREVED